MNRLNAEKRAAVLRCFVEGNSIRSTVRLTGVAKNTVVKLLEDAGRVCAEYQFKTLVNLSCKRVQVDEIWSFVYAKAKNVPHVKKPQATMGDLWTWTALCADTKLVICWLVGKRDLDHAQRFIQNLAYRLTDRVQLSSDGLNLYTEAVSAQFDESVDYGQIIKVFGTLPDAPAGRYSPPVIKSARKEVIIGTPDKANIATSYVERQNLTMRMSMRRFTRLTNGYSKKVQNHAHAVAIHFMHYNFARIHHTLRVSPAMAAGVTDRLWSIEDIVALVEADEAKE